MRRWGLYATASLPKLAIHPPFPRLSTCRHPPCSRAPVFAAVSGSPSRRPLSRCSRAFAAIAARPLGVRTRWYERMTAGPSNNTLLTSLNLGWSNRLLSSRANLWRWILAQTSSQPSPSQTRRAAPPRPRPSVARAGHLCGQPLHPPRAGSSWLERVSSRAGMCSNPQSGIGHPGPIAALPALTTFGYSTGLQPASEIFVASRPAWQHAVDGAVQWEGMRR